MVYDNMIWQIGSGTLVSFWRDKWLSKPLLERLHLSPCIGKKLQSLVSDFIAHGDWHLPRQLQQRYPDMRRNSPHPLA